MRQDLTEAQIKDLLRRSDRCARGEAWSMSDAERVRMLAGEVLRLREREAVVHQMHEIEGSY
jgi:hypothetical protein